jgi:hypothetical protein
MILHWTNKILVDHDKLLAGCLISLLCLAPASATNVNLNPVFNAGTIIDPVEESIDVYKWLLVESNVGSYIGTLADPPDECNPDVAGAGYPAACEWPSIRATKATAPIYSSGDSSEWSKTEAFDIIDAGNYMVTVMAVGYRLCGGYFTVVDQGLIDAGEDLMVDMICQKHPLPLGTIRLFVFEDNAPCNGQFDPGEEGIFDFGIGVNDIEGPITEDYYGNSLLEIVSDENGMIIVPNMWPGRYDLDVGPPPYSGWIKTNTLEGGHGWDYWLFEKWDGYDNEFIVGKEKFPFATAGFTKSK